MSWKWLSDTDVKARLPHVCQVCGTRIAVGESHTARRGIGDDGPVTIRLHSECDNLAAVWSQEEWELHNPGDVKRPVKA